MDILQRSDTMLYLTINSNLNDSKQKLSFYKIGFFILFICVVIIAMGYA